MRCADHILFDCYSLFIETEDFKENKYEYKENNFKNA